MKKWKWVVALSLVLMLVLPLAAQATNLIYAVDEANMLSAETEKTIIDLGNKLSDATKKDGITGAQVAVYTVESLNGRPLEQASLDYARKVGLGSATENNGVLIFIAKADRKFRIETGYGAEGYLPDSVCKRILDEVMTPAFKAGDFDGGTLAAYKVIVGATAAEYGVTVDGSTSIDEAMAGQTTDSHVFIILLVIIFLVVVVIAITGTTSRSTMSYGGSNYKRSSFGGGGGGFGGGGASGGW